MILKEPQVALARQGLNRCTMENIIKRNKLISNIFSLAIYILSIIFCVLTFNNNVKDLAFSGNFEVKLSTVCIVASFVFLMVNILIIVFGYFLKNKLMAVLPIIYFSLFILSFVLLGFFSTDSITNYTLYSLLQTCLMVSLAPVYGVIWVLGPFSLLLFAALLVSSIVILVKLIKQSPKNNKKR